MKNHIWYLDEFDFYKILCPYKYENYLKKTPSNKYHKNDFLFLEHDPVREIMLIDFGKVKIGHYDNTGNECVIAILGRGEILGQMGLLGESKHHTFAEVMEEGTQICKMSVEKAKEMTRDYVPFAMQMNRQISDHIRKLERRIEVLLFKDIKLRLVEFLKDLAIDYGRPRDGGILISHNLTQNDIAMLIGTSRKSASLMMNELQVEGIIRFNRRQIIIPDLKALEKVVAKHKEVAL